MIPDLLLYEITNSLRYKKLDEIKINAAVQSIIGMEFPIAVPSKELLASGVALAFRHDLSVYDAFFIALSERLAYTFITADDKLYQKVKKLGYVQFITDFT